MGNIIVMGFSNLSDNLQVMEERPDVNFTT